MRKPAARSKSPSKKEDTEFNYQASLYRASLDFKEKAEKAQLRKSQKDYEETIDQMLEEGYENWDLHYSRIKTK